MINKSIVKLIIPVISASLTGLLLLVSLGVCHHLSSIEHLISCIPKNLELLSFSISAASESHPDTIHNVLISTYIIIALFTYQFIYFSLTKRFT